MNAQAEERANGKLNEQTDSRMTELTINRALTGEKTNEKPSVRTSAILDEQVD